MGLEYGPMGYEYCSKGKRVDTCGNPSWPASLRYTISIRTQRLILQNLLLPSLSKKRGEEGGGIFITKMVKGRQGERVRFAICSLCLF